MLQCNARMRHVVQLLILMATLALSACAAPVPAQYNPKARVLNWFATNANAVRAEADRHCKQYGKVAHITEMRTDAGGRVLFECA
jgi:starvation-inducible outer membrane lipoprotein